MVIGAYGDRAGRKQALSLTIFAMMLGTALMAFAPTAASIGAWAGVVILVSRLLQGFSAGGEFGTSTAFLIENAPNRKAFYASWQVATQGLAMFLASPYASYISGALIPCDGGGAVDSVKPMIEAAGRLAAEQAQPE